MDLPGLDAGQEREVAGDHQALDVVGIGLAPGLLHHGGEAGHVRLAGPVEAGQGARGGQGVLLRVARHLQPVDAADIFAPPQDLADEAFHRGQRGAAGAILGFRRAAHRQGGEQAAIEVLGDHGVEQEGLAAQHGVLVVAEAGQAEAEEAGEGGLGIGAGGGEPERVEVAEAIREALFHQGQHLLRDLVRLEAVWFRHRHALGGRLAVLGVEVPASAFGLCSVHQQAGFAAHLAVEELHAQLLLAARPGFEARAGAEEAVVLQQDHRDAECCFPGSHVLQHTPFAGQGGDDAGGAVAGGGAGEFA